MQISLTQILLITFLLFALSRVILRFIGGSLSFFGLLFWSALFGSSIFTVIFPSITGNIANAFGVGRGVDAVIYASITLLFYLVFRLYIYLEDIRQEITQLIQKLALRGTDENKKNKNSKK